MGKGSVELIREKVGLFEQPTQSPTSPSTWRKGSAMTRHAASCWSTKGPYRLPRCGLAESGPCIQQRWPETAERRSIAPTTSMSRLVMDSAM